METRTFGDTEDNRFWFDKPMQKNHPLNKKAKNRYQLLWEKFLNKKPNISSKTIKEDIQKIIEDGGFMSDIQEYINKL